MTQFPIQNGIAIIPQGTTIINDRAFFGCQELTSVVIPEGVTAIVFIYLCLIIPNYNITKMRLRLQSHFLLFRLSPNRRLVVCEFQYK